MGAIVGGGILALAGVAFASAGPGAIVAFALNGLIAIITATSFAYLARRFPESGGIYAYSRKLLSIEVAFVVGWVVWFASILAGVLYALGFAAFAAEGLGRLLPLAGISSDWPQGPVFRSGIAVASVMLYAATLMNRTGGGGHAATIGKVIVFTILIGAGIVTWVQEPAEVLFRRLSPFLSDGPGGVVRAMGYTFIALQGFDLIAAVGGSVKDPQRNVPLAMYLSLGIALAIYLPLLFLIATAGAPPEGISLAAAANPEGLVALAAERFMGESGFWLVIGAGVLSMLSALRANLVGASHVAFAMARDRTLPRRLGRVRGSGGAPVIAVAVTSLMIAVIATGIGDVAAAGAASSLIFLISFAMVHWAAVLAGSRTDRARPAIVPVIGAVLCLGLAAFQAFAVPEAGTVVLTWLAIGAALYLTLFASGASQADAAAEARDPDLARLRGRSPLVLVPIANPVRAASLVDVAATLRTPGTGRVLLLSVVVPEPGKVTRDTRALRDAQSILGESLHRSIESALVPETLFTISNDRWSEIGRVARTHDCESVLMGLPDLAEPGMEGSLERVLGGLEVDAVIVRAPHRWRMDEARRILVPIGGRREHSHLRARLLSSLSRSGARSVTFFRVVPQATSAEERRRVDRELRALARDESAGPFEVEIEASDTPVEAIVRRAAHADLVVLGMQRRERGQRPLGELALSIAQKTEVPLVLISRRPQRSLAGIKGRNSNTGDRS